MSLESTSFHEAAHGVVKTIEERHIGPVLSITVIPSEGLLGCVCSAENAFDRFTPRMLRAAGRTAVAGIIAEKLAGFTPKTPDGSDLRILQLGALLSGRGAAFVRECRAGAELQLRSNWGAVTRLADWVRTAGTLTPPYAESLIRLALEHPPRPLAPDFDTLVSLLQELEDVPEFSRQLESAARALSAQVA